MKTKNLLARRQILQILHNCFFLDPLNTIEVGELQAKTNLPKHVILSNLQYLADKKFVEIDEIQTRNSHLFKFCRITAFGIDLVDDPSEFNNHFPPTVIYQQIGGDNLAVTIGDNATDVVVGKDIFKLNVGLSNNSNAIIGEFSNLLIQKNNAQEKAINGLLIKLQNTLKLSEVDLGVIQSVKKQLIEIEGRPPVITSTLFSHPSISNPIEVAIRDIIGRG